ncbi:hypothetical protein N7466_002074 [Penicillium verhagenii]|uniref:uncharacterized protein n=1 Tax=Penicillium verhagenii TaxID=1562060 RepID=UPI0025456538|nr:uncharacterized protein N7466_002074 [Penicillium verhagenii]KAJ5938940.1 hypothetical protein N7466_002074 [Penicillium verhagenii]
MPESKTKIRPQQSCLRCRERKVKCDRSIPCHACIIRGIESECTYLTTAEDREHIGQAEIIDRLRREVAQLRTQLSQSPRPRPRSQGRGGSAERDGTRDRDRDRERGYARLPGSGSSSAHSQSQSRARGQSGKGSGSGSAAGDGVGGVGYAVAGAGAGMDMTDGSWDGSSPSSSAMTHSLSVNSPSSTGSASHAQSVYQGSTFGTKIAEDLTTTSSTAFIGANFMDDAALAYSQGGIPAFAPDEIPASIPMQNLHPQASLMHGMPGSQMYPGNSPRYAVENWSNAPYMHADHALNYSREAVPAPHTSSSGVYQPDSYHQHHPHWEQGHQFTPAQPYLNSYYSSSSGAFAHANTDPHQDLYQSQTLHSQSQSSQPQPISPESISHSLLAMSSSWTGEGKQELLETLLETIGSCDEERVAQVVQVVRASATPEEAVSGICQVLGIGSGR